MTTVKIAVSSRALFQLEEENAVYEEHKPNLEHYKRFVQERQNDPLEPGSAYPLIMVIGEVNKTLKKYGCRGRFEVIVLTRNDEITAKRVFDHVHELDYIKVTPTDGENPVDYLKSLESNVFLTFNEDDVREALVEGYAAALMSKQNIPDVEKEQLRIAFDLDSVLDADQTRKISVLYKEGPLKKLADAILRIQKEFYETTKDMNPRPQCPIQTYALTARWLDESLKIPMLNETIQAVHSKSDKLREIQPNIFFGDKPEDIEDALNAGVRSAEMPNPIT